MTEDSPIERMGWMRFAVPALLCAAVLGIALLSLRQPLSADDYTFSLALRAHPTLPGFVSHQYAAWTGRMTGMALLWFALSHRTVYALLNGIAFGALVWLTVALALGRAPRPTRADGVVLTLVLATYWYGLPAIAETVSWVTGSATYLWSAVLMLAFALPYRIDAGSDTPHKHTWWAAILAALGMAVLGALAGASQELVVAALVVVLAAYGAHAVRRGGLRRVPPHLWAGAAALLGGGAFLFLAPGNGVRAATSANHAGSLAGSLVQFATFIGKSFGSYLPSLYPWLLCALVLAVPVALLSGSEAGRAGGPRYWVLWVAAGLAALVPFVVQPGVALLAGARTNMFAAVLLTVAAVSLLGDAGNVLDRVPLRWSQGVSAALLLLVLLEIAGSVQVANTIGAQVAEREAYVAAQLNAGVRDLTVPPLAQKPYRTVYYVDIESDPTYWLNEGLAEWYGAKSIKLGIPVPK
jgi:hypothetical protein